MDENPDVPTADITPEDFDGDMDTPKVDSSPKEEQKPEAKEETPKEEVKPDDTGTPPEEETPEETDTDKPPEETPTDEEPETPKPTKAEERKTQLNTEIRDLVAQRNALKKEVEKQTGEVYQVATEADLVDDGMSVTDARVEVIRQQMEVRDYNDRVSEAQLTLSSEVNRVMNEFPMFNSESDQFDQELTEEAAQLLEANLIRDDNVPEIGIDGKPTGKGLIIGSNVSPYRFYKTLARAASISATKGQLKGQQAREEMAANADSPGSVAPPKKAADPLAELWKDDL